MTPIPNDIQAALGDLPPHHQARLGRIIATLGEERTRAVVSEAQQLQAAGGMRKPTGEPRSTIGIVGVLIAQTCSHEEQAAIFADRPLGPPAPLDPALLPIAEILRPLSRNQQAMLGRMLAVLGIDRLRTLVAEAQAHEAAGGFVPHQGPPITGLRYILWRLVTNTTTRAEADAIFTRTNGATGATLNMTQRWHAVCARLGETDQHGVYRIKVLIRVIGIEAVEAAASEAEEIEAQGGMWLADGSRKRTLGGVFFHLLKGRLTPQQLVQVPGWAPKTPRPAAPPSPKAVPEEPEFPAFVWAERRAIYQELGQEVGEGKVKVSLVGRPGRVVEKPTVVITALTTHKMPALPRSVPAAPPTVYTVYLAVGQWAKVKDAIQDPEDVLIIEGVAGYDPELEGVVVSATAVTTRGLQRAKKAAPSST